MNILADENIPGRVVRTLREEGHEVLWARDTYSSSADTFLLEMANNLGRTLITLDTDFGEILYRDRIPAARGIILFRLHKDVPRVVQEDFMVSSVMAWNTWPPGLWTIQIRHQPNPA